jgi:hypothetical protein
VYEVLLESRAERGLRELSAEVFYRESPGKKVKCSPVDSVVMHGSTQEKSGLLRTDSETCPFIGTVMSK